MSKFLYPIYKLKTKSYIKWWLYHKKAGGSGILSEILEGFSFNLENTLNRKFKLFEIEGNSVQDGSPSPDNEVPILSAGDNGSINEKITNSDGTKEQDYSIPVQQPMRSIGDVRDCFVKKSDGWYERHYIGRKIFDGTESWISQQNCFTLSINDIKPTPNYADRNQLITISNYYIGQVSEYRGAVNNLNVCKAIDAGNPRQVAIKDTSKTLAEFKAWLAEQYTSGKPVYVDYLLEEPLDLPCTPEQIQQLENLPSTYKDFTIIQSQDETPAYLKIQYYKEG